MVGRKHVHRSALAARNARCAPGQFSHDQIWINPVGKHVAVIAVARNHAILTKLKCRLKPHSDCFLPNIQMAKSTNQTKPVKLAGAFLKTADQHHFPVETEKLILAGLVPLWRARRIKQFRSGGFGQKSILPLRQHGYTKDGL